MEDGEGILRISRISTILNTKEDCRVGVILPNIEEAGGGLGKKRLCHAD